MKTREQIIESMCLTLRHDYLMEKGRFCGMTEEERESLRERMTQIFDNDILPNMEFRKEDRKSELVHDGIIKVHSFDFTDRQKKRIALGLRYGPDSAAMKDDGTFHETPEPQSWKNWMIRKFSIKS